MKPATLDDAISVLDFSVVYKSIFRKTILLVTLLLSVVNQYLRYLRVCNFTFPIYTCIHVKHEHIFNLIIRPENYL